MIRRTARWAMHDQRCNWSRPSGQERTAMYIGMFRPCFLQWLNKACALSASRRMWQLYPAHLVVRAEIVIDDGEGERQV